MSAVIDPALLSEIALFHRLSRAKLTRLNDLPHRKTFQAGTTFISAEQPGEVS